MSNVCYLAEILIFLVVTGLYLVVTPRYCSYLAVAGGYCLLLVVTARYSSLLLVPTFSMNAIATVQAARKEMSKVIHFSKCLKIGETSGKVLLSVKLQALLYKSDSTRGFFLEAFRKFAGHLGINNISYFLME